MVSEFDNLGLLPTLMQAVEQLGFEQPTPIQKVAIPALLEGRDVIGQAQTGTGKTAAFALPMLQHIQSGLGVVQALILTPTRELAIQVAEATATMAKHTKLKVMAVYGGQSYDIQIRQIKRGADVVVGTPGRLLDLMRQKILDLSHVSYLVLDEADEMLEMGFIEDVETILSQIPEQRQIALFSATLPEAVRKLAERYLTNPQQITVSKTRITVPETEQCACLVREDSKLAALTRLLEVEEVKNALVFARTKARAQEIAEDLMRRGYPAESLHGDLTQSRREYVLNRFRAHTVTLLVATDVAARGLDIDDLSHVFNYDVPADPEDYVHRIGRTGRAGRKGIAITFFTPREQRRMKQIEAFTRQPMKQIPLPKQEEILAKRDERFMERLAVELGKEKDMRERALIFRMAKVSTNLEEIALAAIRLARAGENALKLEDINEPVIEPKKERSTRRQSAPVETDKKARKNGKKPFQGDAVAEPFWGRSQQPEQGMVRLRMNLGNVHGLRPGDVVGAIASEAGIPGRAIGEIDIRKDYTFVDVAEKHVQQVLRESSGSYYLRGKPVLLKKVNS